MIFNITLTKLFTPLLIIFFSFFSSVIMYFKIHLDILEKNQVQVFEQLEKIASAVTENGKIMKEVLGSSKNTINVVNSSPDQFYMGITSGDIVVGVINVVGFICIAYFLFFCLDQVGTQFSADLKVVDSNASGGVDVMRSEICSNTQQIVNQIIEAAQLPNHVILENLVAIRTNLLCLDPEIKISNTLCPDTQMTSIFAEYLTNGTPPPFL